MTGLLIAGTTSDAGKSVVTTGLCRALARRGVRVAPFKAQNMSNNSMVCAGATGQMAEIGRAQWIQAVAAQITPEPVMNPVLLKPGDNHRSHVVLLGQPAGELSATNWIEGRQHLATAAFAAFDELSARYDIVLAEGAGSPAEINLRSSDYVNLGLAKHAALPAVVVGDIDRGGVFASLFGTVAVLEATDQEHIAGFIVNKFRGNEALLAPGITALEQWTGRRVFGVLPWQSDVWLDSEDALELASRASTAQQPHRVAVIRLPRISNFTDVDALGLEPDLDVRFVSHPRDIGDAKLIVLPGTRSTISDLAWLRHHGLDQAIVEHAQRGGAVLGICGGFQMLGGTIADPDGVEGPPGVIVSGLGLVDADTIFEHAKNLRLPTGNALGAAVSGYEIHHGKVSVGTGQAEFLGGIRGGPHHQVFGTMWHGSLEGDAFRQAFLYETLDLEPSGVSFAQARENRIEALADLVEAKLDVSALIDLAQRTELPRFPVIQHGLEKTQ